MTDSKPSFKRQESWRYKRVHENWRRPRGVTSKMRKEESGFPAKVKVGYGSAAATRGLHPRGLIERRVWRMAELDELDPKIHIIRIAAQVGERKRLGLVEKAKQLNFHIANPGKEEARPIAEPSGEKAPASIEGDTPETPEKMSETEESSTEAADGEDAQSDEEDAE